MEAEYQGVLQPHADEPQGPSGIANVLSIQPLQSAPILPDEYVHSR